MKPNLPIYLCSEQEPEECVLLRLFFEDGSHQEGVLMRKDVYWSRGQQVHPVKWQLLPRVGMVAKAPYINTDDAKS